MTSYQTILLIIVSVFCIGSLLWMYTVKLHGLKPTPLKPIPLVQEFPKYRIQLHNDHYLIEQRVQLFSQYFGHYKSYKAIRKIQDYNEAQAYLTYLESK